MLLRTNKWWWWWWRSFPFLYEGFTQYGPYMATELLKAELTLVNDACDSNWSATNSQQMKTKLRFSCRLSYWWWLKWWLRRRLTKNSLITKNGCVLFPELLSHWVIQRICGLLEGILRVTNSLNSNNNIIIIKRVARSSTTSYSYSFTSRTNSRLGQRGLAGGW